MPCYERTVDTAQNARKFLPPTQKASRLCPAAVIASWQLSQGVKSRIPNPESPPPHAPPRDALRLRGSALPQKLTLEKGAGRRRHLLPRPPQQKVMDVIGDDEFLDLDAALDEPLLQIDRLMKFD